MRQFSICPNRHLQLYLMPPFILRFRYVVQMVIPTLHHHLDTTCWIWPNTHLKLYLMLLSIVCVINISSHTMDVPINCGRQSILQNRCISNNFIITAPKPKRKQTKQYLIVKFIYTTSLFG